MSQVLIISYAKFHQHGFRDVGLLPLKNRKFVFSGINFPQISSLKRFFCKIYHGEGVPGPHPYAKFHYCGFRNAGSLPPKLSITGRPARSTAMPVLFLLRGPKMR